MENKKNGNGVLVGVLVGILIGIVIMLLVFFGLRMVIPDLASKMFMPTTVKINDDKETSEKILDNEEQKDLLSKLSGIWKYETKTGSKYAIKIDIDNSFSYGLYGTDGGIFGEIKSIKLFSNDTYEFYIYSPACHGYNCIDEKDEEDYYYIINIADINNRKFSINISNSNLIFEYAGSNWEDSASKFGY